MMEIPKGYVHKATSESRNSAEKVVIYYNTTWDDYLVVINDAVPRIYVTKSQLQLLLQSATDVLEMDSR